RILRAASVFGEQFWARGVEALVDSAAPEVTHHLDQLVIAEVISPRTESRFAGETEYSFRHGLVRDAAYAMLTEDDRRLGHRLAGQWLADADEARARVLAEHFDRGRAVEAAAYWHVRAAGEALGAVDFYAAIAHARRAIELGAAGELRRQAHEIAGASHMGLGRWQDAPAELRAALELVSLDNLEKRAE